MVGIITDSTCDIPDEILQQYGIIVVPAYTFWGNEQYRDRMDLQPTEFYRRLVEDIQLPHSSMPSMQDFQAAFNCAIQRGAESIIVITVSSAMSGTYQHARLAAEQATVPVQVIDAKGPSMSLGWQVLAAARVQAAGADFNAMVKSIDRAREKMIQFVGWIP